MTFLQPILLWALPLALTPILIHLVNRMRHRSIDWGAMRFLIQARQSSTRFAKLRRFLLLACRTLLLVALICALSRPLLGGLVGRLFSGPPDTVIVLLDRSSSMETRLAGNTECLRERALHELADGAGKLEGLRRLILIDSVGKQAVELSTAGQLDNAELWGGSDTAADFPTLLEKALATLEAAGTARSEIWIASDLQRSNWRPDDEIWKSLRQRFLALPQDVSFRLLASADSAGNNASIRLLRCTFLPGSPDEIELEFEVASRGAGNTLRVASIEIGDQTVNVELPAAERLLTATHRFVLPEGMRRGQGKIHLAPDSNERDNHAFFSFAPPPPATTLIVAENPKAATILGLAAAPDENDPNCLVQQGTPALAGSLEKVALLVWQGNPPGDDVRPKLEHFVKSGGILLFFPGESEGDLLGGLAWGKTSRSETETGWPVSSWDQGDGPLRNSDAGQQLSVNHLKIQQRTAIVGEAMTNAAAFPDQTPFVCSRGLGNGEIWLCATLPLAEWSNLGRGTVLLPLVQRLLSRGSSRLGKLREIDCGTPYDKPLLPLLTTFPGDQSAPTAVAGVFQSGNLQLLLRRPAEEDLPTILKTEEVQTLFGELPLHLLHDETNHAATLHSEFWMPLIFLALLFMLGEAFLTATPAPGKVEGKK